MKKLLPLAWLILANAMGCAGEKETIDSMVKTYIQAINARNTNALKDLVISACKTNLALPEAKDLTYRLQVDMGLTIPEDAKIQVRDFSGKTLLAKATIWKVTPVKEIEIVYKTGKGGITMNRFAAEENGRWRLVYPFLDITKLDPTGQKSWQLMRDNVEPTIITNPTR